MSGHADVIREQVSHIARGCRSGLSHNPAPYEAEIVAALDALVAERDEALQDTKRAVASADYWRDFEIEWRARLEVAEKERDAALKRGDYWRDERERTGELLVAAEAEVARLQAKLATFSPSWNAALAAEYRP